MLGPGVSWFARDDASAPMRAPSLYRVDSVYVTEARSAAEAGQSMIVAITAAAAIALIWLAGRLK